MTDRPYKEIAVHAVDYSGVIPDKMERECLIESFETAISEAVKAARNTVTCTRCGFQAPLWVGESETPMEDHFKVCPANPYLERIKQLESELEGFRTARDA